MQKPLWNCQNDTTTETERRKIKSERWRCFNMLRNREMQMLNLIFLIAIIMAMAFQKIKQNR